MNPVLSLSNQTNHQDLLMTITSVQCSQHHVRII